MQRLLTPLLLVVGYAIACGSGGSDPPPAGSSGGGSSSGGSSGTSSGGAACETKLPTSSDPSPAPGCAGDEDCVVRPTGNACCPQGDQAMTKAAADALPDGGPYCACEGTPCAYHEPISEAHCAEGVCMLGPRPLDAGADGG